MPNAHGKSRSSTTSASANEQLQLCVITFLHIYKEEKLQAGTPIFTYRPSVQDFRREFTGKLFLGCFPIAFCSHLPQGLKQHLHVTEKKFRLLVLA